MLFRQRFLLPTTLPVYHDKGTPPKKGGRSSFTVTKLPSSLEPKGQRPLSLSHSPKHLNSPEHDHHLPSYPLGSRDEGSFVLLKMDCVRVARGVSLSTLHRENQIRRLCSFLVSNKSARVILDTGVTKLSYICHEAEKKALKPSHYFISVQF